MPTEEIIRELCHKVMHSEGLKRELAAKELVRAIRLYLKANTGPKQDGHQSLQRAA